MLKKKLAIAVVVLFLSVSIYSCTSAKTTNLANTIYVDDDNTEGPWDGTQEHPYQYIQEAIDNSSDGDTVFVYNGTYFENVVIDKSIKLQGEDKYSTIIDGMGASSYVINIRKDKTHILGFTVINAKYYDVINKGAGIFFVKSSNILISDNVISNAYWGICAEYSRNCIISQCSINNTVIGICILSSDGNKINNSEIFDNNVGIVFQASWFNTITNNIIKNNNVGLELYYWYVTGLSSFNKITYNSYIENNVGVNIEDCWPNTYCYNNFIKNKKSLTFSLPIFSTLDNFNYNYWNRSRLLPKVIFGRSSIYSFPAIIIDWFPAKEPYDIPIQGCPR